MALGYVASRRDFYFYMRFADRYINPLDLITHTISDYHVIQPWALYFERSAFFRPKPYV